jgi:hypothetical protein
MWSSVRTYSRGELYKLVEAMKTRAIRVQICQGFNGLSFIRLLFVLTYQTKKGHSRQTLQPPPSMNNNLSMNE